MAVRRPLYNDSGDIRQMTDAMIDDIIQFCIFKHQSGLPIALIVVSVENIILNAGCIKVSFIS